MNLLIGFLPPMLTLAFDTSAAPVVQAPPLPPIRARWNNLTHRGLSFDVNLPLSPNPPKDVTGGAKVGRVGGRSLTAMMCVPASPEVTSEQGRSSDQLLLSPGAVRVMTRPGWVVHKRAFVTLGHKSLPSACSRVSHKGIVQ